MGREGTVNGACGSVVSVVFFCFLGRGFVGRSPFFDITISVPDSDELSDSSDSTAKSSGLSSSAPGVMVELGDRKKSSRCSIDCDFLIDFGGRASVPDIRRRLCGTAAGMGGVFSVEVQGVVVVVGIEGLTAMRWPRRHFKFEYF